LPSAVPPPARVPPDLDPPDVAAPPATTVPASEEPIVGTPDAPRVVRVVDPQHVPDLSGLALSDAEQWVRDAGMSLNVERVGGHPLGRVLEQIPAAGAPRPPGGIVKVIVTAGGDFEDHAPGAPSALVPEVEVPDLLDRTAPQARRILEDLGLKVKERVAARGLAGRVVDQQPALGERLVKGEYVLVWIGPPDETAPPEPSAGSAAPPRVPAAPEPREPAPSAPERKRPAPKEAPVPIAPLEGTRLPREATIALGFSWEAVEGVRTYLVEVEEESAQGTWIGILKKPVRQTAAAIEVERLSVDPARRLRWRVRGVGDSGEGPPSPWITMR
jgi:hypothetical protein